MPQSSLHSTYRLCCVELPLLRCPQCHLCVVQHLVRITVRVAAIGQRRGRSGAARCHVRGCGCGWQGAQRQIIAGRAVPAALSPSPGPALTPLASATQSGTTTTCGIALCAALPMLRSGLLAVGDVNVLAVYGVVVSITWTAPLVTSVNLSRLLIFLFLAMLAPPFLELPNSIRY